MSHTNRSVDSSSEDDEYDEEVEGDDDSRDYATRVWLERIQPYINKLTYRPMIIFIHEAWEPEELDGYVYIMPESYTKQQFIDQFCGDGKSKELWKHFGLGEEDNCFPYGHVSTKKANTLHFHIDAHVYRVNFDDNESLAEEGVIQAMPQKAAWCVVDHQTYGRPMLDIFN
jgi:hypothetical protein